MGGRKHTEGTPVPGGLHTETVEPVTIKCTAATMMVLRRQCTTMADAASAAGDRGFISRCCTSALSPVRPSVGRWCSGGAFASGDTLSVKSATLQVQVPSPRNPRRSTTCKKNTG